MHTLFTSFGRAVLLAVTVLSLVLSPPLRAQAPGNGVIEGRVFNAGTGKALVNAKVSLEGLNREMLTDETGSFRFAAVPAGEQQLAVSYLGLDKQTVPVTVTSGGVASQEFNLSRGASHLDGEPLKLEKFTVVAESEMSAQDIAVNEQRNAPNIKNVVAIDEYGDRGNENIGEFLLFIPGVAIQTSGPDPSQASIRGFPAGATGILIDGGEVAGSFTENSRGLDLREVPMTNVSRVEVTKVPTPDVPANGLGGTINLISKSGFESKKPLFTYQIYELLHDNGNFALGGDRNHSPKTSPKFREPSFNLSYLRPIGRNLALSFGLARTFKYKPMERGSDYSDERPVWNQITGIQSRSRWSSLAQLTETFSAQAGLEWRISATDLLSASFQYRDFSLITTRSNIDVVYGAGVTGDATFSQGAVTGVGSMNQGNSGANGETATESSQMTLKYRHRGENWRIDASAFWSGALNERRDMENGFFNLAPSAISNLIIRGEGIGEGGTVSPVRYSAVTRLGAPVNIFDGANYSITSGTSDESDRETTKSAARLDVSRDFRAPFPFTLKAGLSIDRLEKDERRYQETYNFRPNGASDEASRRAGNFAVFDDEYNAAAPAIFGTPMRWISGVKLYDLYKQNPNWFVLDEPSAWQNSVNSSRLLKETVSAAYLRIDTRLMNNRLWLVGGVRFEGTEVEGWGRLDDFSAQYQKDANGNLLLNSSGQRILVTSDVLALRKLRFVERGSHGKQTYGDFYPSVNSTFNISDNLLLRAAYARTLGRPELNFIVPGVGISDPSATLPLITVTNQGLIPWTADNFDLSLETYYLKDGFGSIGVFQKNIKNFFNTVTTDVTPALLERYGLDPTDPLLLNYDIRTQTNGGDAKITGFEIGYRQSLTFLPKWARGFQVFVNYTKLDLEGDREADFDGFNPEVTTAGVNFVRNRYFIKINVSILGQLRTAPVSTNVAGGIPANTFDYQAARTRWAVNGQYNINRRLAFFASMTDIGGLVNTLQRYDPKTPEYAKISVRQKLGYYLTLGVNPLISHSD